MKTTVVKKQITPEDVGLSAWFPLHPSDVDYINKFGDGEPFQADIKRDRFYPLTQKYWALCEFAAKNNKMPEYRHLNLDTKQKVDEHIKLTLRLIKGYIVYPGVCPHCNNTIDIVHVQTGSISNEAMGSDKFQLFFNDAIQEISSITGVSVYDLDKNWMDYETGVA